MNGTTFLCLFKIGLFSSQSCYGEEAAGRWLWGKSRRQIETRKKFCAEKPCRDLNSAIIWRHLQARGFSDLKITKWVSKHERCELWHKMHKRDITKSDTMEDSQVTHSDVSSMASTKGGPVAWSSDQILNSQARTGRLVIKDSVNDDVDVEATEECNILSAASISFREKVNERVRARRNRAPGDEVEETDMHSLIWSIYMT